MCPLKYGTKREIQQGKFWFPAVQEFSIPGALGYIVGRRSCCRYKSTAKAQTPVDDDDGRYKMKKCSNAKKIEDTIRSSNENHIVWRCKNVCVKIKEGKKVGILDEERR